MSYSTGNPERDRLLLAAIKQVIAAKKTPSLKLVARALPEDFELDQEELDGALQFNFGPLPKSLENIEPPQANEPAQPHDPPAEPAPIPEMAARGLLAKAAIYRSRCHGDRAIGPETETRRSGGRDPAMAIAGAPTGTADIRAIDTRHHPIKSTIQTRRERRQGPAAETRGTARPQLH
jgi:hypothetical protein